jgi:peptidoglycan hydrolase CwlO-like protein
MFGYHTSCQNLLDSQEKTKVQQRSTAVSQASELDKQQVTMRQMQRRIGELEESEANLKLEVQKLRSGLEELDRERDELVMSTKEGTEEVSALQNRLQQLVRECVLLYSRSQSCMG